MMFCGKCGFQVQDDAAFCPSCGEKIISENKVMQEPEVPKTNDEKKRNPFVAVLCIVLAIIVAVGGIFAVMYDRDYKKAIRLVEDGQFDKAEALIAELDEEKQADFLFLNGRKEVTHNYNNNLYGDTYTYTFDENGNCLEERCVDDDGDLDYTYTCTYDDHNNLLTKVKIDGDGEFEYSYTYTYDEFDNCIFEECRAGETYSTSISYTYDANNNCIEEVYTENDGEQRRDMHSYDENGNCIQSQRFFESGSVVTWEYEYDDNGNCIKEVHISPNGIRSPKTYTYDDNDNCIKILNGDESCFNTYDDDGNLIKEEWKYEGEIYETTEYFYNEYDRLIKTVETDEEGDTDTCEYFDCYIFYRPKAAKPSRQKYDKQQDGDAVKSNVTGMLTTTTTYTVPEPVVKTPADPDYFCLEASGDYSDGILLPELENATVTMMMAVDWAYLETNNNPADPFARYHATLIWRDAYASKQGDVAIVTISDEQQTDYLIAQTASGTAPDIIPADYVTYPRWNAAGLTASVEDYSDYLQLDALNPNNADESLYNVDLINALFQWEGKTHAVITTRDVDRQYIVYNKTKFQNANIVTPLEQWQNGQWTWTNFVKTCKAMTNGDDYGFTGWGLFPYFAPYPMASLNQETGAVELAIDNPNYMLFMNEVYDLYQNEGAARCDSDLQTWSTTFPAGTDAMVQTTLASYKRIVESARRIEGDEFGIAPVPAFDLAGEKTGIASATVWGYSVSAAAENPIGAAAYIRLETLVSRNISAALEGTTWYDRNLTEEEQAMIDEIANDPVCIDMIRGIGNCYLGIVDAQIVPEMYYTKTETPVRNIFDSQRNALQAEFDEFNSSIS